MRGVEYIVGVSAVINGDVINRLLQTAEYEVSVTKELFEMTKSTVTTLSTVERLLCDAASR